MPKAPSGKPDKKAGKKTTSPKAEDADLSPPSWLANYSDDYYESVLQQRHVNENKK